MNRRIDVEFQNWHRQPSRKPLLVRGARQVGKTYSVRAFGREFSSFVEVNLEEFPQLGIFFENDQNPKTIIEKLSQYVGEAIVPGKTLLFLDEIQACPNALRSLRFFYEQMPDLAVVSAGSLLEFALAEIPSFGVGRISSLFMYPMSFFEFLDAVGEGLLGDAIRQADWHQPLAQPLHQKAMALLRTYMVLGGLPEGLAYYAENSDALGVQKILDELLVTLMDDFAKYKGRISTDRMDATFKAITLQMGRKFSFSAVGEGSTTGFSTALDLLVKAGLAIKVYHSSCRGVPLAAQIKPSRFKVLPLDCGLYQRVMRLDLQSYLVGRDIDLVNKGPLAELYVGLALLSTFPNHVRPELHYWHREQRGSNAEVDYVFEHKGRAYPVEVKASKRGGMQSLRLFLAERGLDHGIRIAGEAFASYEKIRVVPLYAAENLRILLDKIEADR